MRPLRLELRGFTAFREPAVVDFTGRRLFVITGATGAGKSSLLDAIVWALYGQVPRVGRATRQLVTHGEKSMAVRFDFRARGATYRVARNAPGAVGTRLEQLVDGGEWRPLADRAPEVTAQVTQLLGLDYQTFTKTVLLPQGAFDSFLRGDEPQRREILTRLLGLDTYQEVGRAARTRARVANETAGALRGQLERLALAAPGVLEGLEVERERLEASAAELETRRELLSKLGALARSAEEAGRAAAGARADASAAATALVSARDAAEEAERALTEAVEGRAAVAGERAALGYDAEEHQRLRDLAALMRHRDEARAAVEAAARELEQARAALEVARTAEERTRAEASEHALRAESASAELATAASALSGAAADARAAVARLTAEAAEADRARAAAEEEAAEHERSARALDTLAGEVEKLLAEHASAAHAEEEARDERSHAEAAAGRSGAALAEAEAAAVARREALDTARLRDAAVALQRSVQEGEPCPVCGGTVGHVEPHAAPDLDAAESAVEAAERAVAGARAAHQRCEAALARAAATAGHVSDALSRVGERLAAVDRELARVDVERDGVTGALASAGECAAAARANAAELAGRADGALAAERELSLLLARVPAETEATAAAHDEQTAEGADVEGSLRGGLERHAAAAETSRRAGEGRGAADQQLRERRSATQQAEAAAASAQRALDNARQRLDSLSGEREGDAAAIRAALDDMERLAHRAGELAQAAQAAEAAHAAASVRRDERGSDRERAAALAAEREAAATVAAEREREARTAFQELWREVAGPDETPQTGALPAMLERHGAAVNENAQALGAVRERVEQARREVEEADRMRSSIRERERAASVAGALERELHADRFVAYVQQEALRVLAVDASQRLRQLTSGRYLLAIDGNQFLVVDRLNGDEQRSVKTLSGGETFLASLALSLALAERLPELAGTGGAVSLESLFLDEGFGSLDAASLDVAIDGLESLAGGERMVGVISHVPEIAERLQDRIEVVRGDRTSTLRNGEA